MKMKLNGQVKATGSKLVELVFKFDSISLMLLKFTISLHPSSLLTQPITIIVSSHFKFSIAAIMCYHKFGG